MSARRGAALLTLASVLFLALNLVTATRYPAPWVDEIQFGDPAVNLALHGEFSSTVWIVQTAHEFWAGNTPLYPYLLAQWLRLFGVSPMAARSFNYVLVIFAGWLFWILLRRTGVVLSEGWRLTAVLLFWTAQGVTFCYRMGRYDVTGMVLFLLAALVWTAPDGALSSLALFVIATLFPLAGLQLIPSSALLCLVLVLFLGWPALRRAAALGAGVLAGIGLLYLLYAQHGVWQAFRASTSAVGTIGAGIAGKLRGLPGIYAGDKSMLLLLLVAGLLLLTIPSLRRTWRKQPLIFGIAVAIVVPTALQLAAKFPIYYAWMALLPLLAGVISALERSAPSKPVRACALVGLVLASAVGLPARLAVVAVNWDSRSLAPIDRFVAANIAPEDVVVGDFKAYYALKTRVRAYYAHTYVGIMTAEERRSVNVLLLRDRAAPAVQQALGGSWIDTGLTMPGARTASKAALRFLGDLREEEYEVRLYRKAPDTTRGSVAPPAP
jgi:hypothetical protein